MKYAKVKDGAIQKIVTDPQEHTSISLGDSVRSKIRAGLYPIYDRDPGPATHPNVNVPREEVSGETLMVGERAVYRKIEYADRPLAGYKEALSKKVRDLRIENARTPVTHDGNEFDADQQAQSKLTGKLTYAQATGKDSGSTWSVGWKTANDSFVQLTYDDLAAVVEAVNTQVQQAYNREAELLQQIEKATTHDELDSIDVTSGWP